MSPLIGAQLCSNNHPGIYTVCRLSLHSFKNQRYKKKKKLALQEEGTRETVITILTLKTDSHLGNAESIRHIRGVICNIT